MQLYFSEFPANYDHYSFPYQVLMKKEHGDDPVRIYQSGFLPFRSKPDLYYLARSTRIRLHHWEPNSENRRILSKTADIQLTFQPLQQIQYTPEIQKFCAAASKQLGEGQAVIPTSAIRKMYLGQANVNHLLTFTHKSTNQILGYTLIYAHGSFVHYAHPFITTETDQLDPDLVKNLNIGMMTHAIQWAYDQHKQFIYLGTCYTHGARYKTKFNGFEWFNGLHWTDNQDELKAAIDRQSDHYTLQDDAYQTYLDGLDLTTHISDFRAKFK